MARLTRLDEVADVQIGYLFRGKLVDDPQGDFPVLLMRNARPDGLLDLTDCPRARLGSKAERYTVQDGDAVFLSRGTAPMAYLVENTGRTFVASNHFYILRTNPHQVLPEFLVWAINQPAAQAFVLSRSAGTAAQLVAKASLGELAIPVPAMDIQRRVVELQRLLTRERELSHRLLAARDTLVNEVCRRMAEPR